MTHSECVRKLKKIGENYGFVSGDGTKLGKLYHLGNPDCVWYYFCRGNEALRKIAEGDRCKLKIRDKDNKDRKCKRHGPCEYLPLIAFEVPNSEDEKALRGSLMTLQLTNASASVLVLIGRSAQKHESYIQKLVGRYSFSRLRIWTEEYVDKLYSKISYKLQ